MATVLFILKSYKVVGFSIFLVLHTLHKNNYMTIFIQKRESYVLIFFAKVACLMAIKRPAQIINITLIAFWIFFNDKTENYIFDILFHS